MHTSDKAQVLSSRLIEIVLVAGIVCDGDVASVLLCNLRGWGSVSNL